MSFPAVDGVAVVTPELAVLCGLGALRGTRRLAVPLGPVVPWPPGGPTGALWYCRRSWPCPCPEGALLSRGLSPAPHLVRTPRPVRTPGTVDPPSADRREAQPDRERYLDILMAAQSGDVAGTRVRIVLESEAASRAEEV